MTARHTPARDPLVLGALVATALVLAFFLGLKRSIPFVGGGGRVVHAEFAAARQVTPKTPVRVRGVDVGKVESVRYDPARQVTVVAFRLDDDSIHLHRDASAALRWRTLLGGNMELALDPGSASAPTLRDDRIPLKRTRIQTELEDVTHVFDGQGAAGQRALLRELPEALKGDAAGRAIDELAPGLRPMTPAMRALRGRRPDDLRALIASSSRAVRAIEAARSGLGDLVGGAQRTLQVTARDRSHLEATLQHAPAALDATTKVARAIDATLPDLDGLVADLRPGARKLGPVLARTRPTLIALREVLRDARPLVAQLRPAVDRLADTSASGRRLLAALDPTLRRLADDIVPYLAHHDDELDLPIYQLIGPTFSTLSAAAAQYDGISHAINFPAAPAENSLSLIPCATFLTDPTAQQKIRCDDLNRALNRLLGARPKGKP